MDGTFILNSCTIYLAICWTYTLYIAFFVYDKNGFASNGYNRRGINKFGQTKSKKHHNNDTDDEYTDTPTFDDNGKEIINNNVNTYSRMEHIPEMLPFMTIILFIAYFGKN